MAADPIVPFPELQIETEQTATETIFRCTGRITAATSPELQDAVRSVIAEKKNVVLNLSKVTHIDSTGLGALVSLWASAKRAGCELRLVSLSDRIKELMHLTSLDKVFAASKFPDKPSF